MDLRGSGGLRFERDHYKTHHHQSNYWDHGGRGVPFQPCGNRPINSNLAIVTEADKESIKSTSIYAGRSAHLGLFQGRNWKRSGTMWQMSKIHSFIMSTVQRKNSNFFFSKYCLPWSLALNRCMILGYRVESIITALYFQCPMSYLGKQKPTNFIILVWCFLFDNCRWFGQQRKDPPSCLPKSTTVQTRLQRSYSSPPPNPCCSVSAMPHMSGGIVWSLRPMELTSRQVDADVLSRVLEKCCKWPGYLIVWL